MGDVRPQQLGCMMMKHIKTPVLHLAYEETGLQNGEPLPLVHGWPDSPLTRDDI